MHNWVNVAAGTYHFFHHRWISSISDQLNSGILPKGFFAMAEQIIGGPAPDVVALKDWLETTEDATSNDGALALAEPQTAPMTTYVLEDHAEEYVAMKNQIVIKHNLGKVVSVIELVSPGNKHSVVEITRLIEKAAILVRAGINLLIVDPFPPTLRDPNGIPALIWAELYGESSFQIPDRQTLTVSSYQAEPPYARKAYIEPLKVGDFLPIMPLFLVKDRYVNLSLEVTYSETWSKLPNQVQRAVQGT
ncbi:MAG: DUF4058 family protein [Pirellula sp.]